MKSKTESRQAPRVLTGRAAERVVDKIFRECFNRAFAPATEEECAAHERPRLRSRAVLAPLRRASCRPARARLTT